MKKYSIYIFDLDGTITDTTGVWLDIYREGLTQLGITPPDDKTLAWYTHDWKELTKLGLAEEKVADFATLAHRLANERLPQAPLHVGALEVLQSLKGQGNRIAIFSTMDRQIFEPTMKHRNLYAIAEVSVAGTDVPHRKPHPAGILKALEDLGISSEEYNDAVYVGDKDTDIQAANGAGIDSILFFPSSHQAIYDLNELTQHKPTHVITDWQELLSVVP